MAAEVALRHGLQRIPVVDLVPIEIDHWETQFVVPPDEFAVLDAESRKSVRVQPRSDIRVGGVREESLEIDRLLEGERHCRAAVRDWPGMRMSCTA